MEGRKWPAHVNSEVASARPRQSEADQGGPKRKSSIRCWRQSRKPAEPHQDGGKIRLQELCLLTNMEYVLDWGQADSRRTTRSYADL